MYLFRKGPGICLRWSLVNTTVIHKVNIRFDSTRYWNPSIIVIFVRPLKSSLGDAFRQISKTEA